MTNELDKVVGALKKARTVGLMTHVGGDGDAFGSLLAMRDILTSLGKKTFTFSTEPLPDYMGGLEQVANYKPEKHFHRIDLLVVLDLGTVKRLTVPAIYEKARQSGVPTMIIDHHDEGDMYDAVEIVWRRTDYSSTSEMIYHLAEKMGVTLSQSGAQYLLWGVETDSNFMRNPNVNPKTTHKVEAKLMKAGANLEEIRRSLEAASPIAHEQFRETVLGRMRRDKKTGIASVYVTGKELKKFKMIPGISSALSNYLDQTINPSIAFVAEQRKPGVIKISMRANSSQANVAKLAGFFGGGGHVKAAGFEVKGDLEKILDW